MRMAGISTDSEMSPVIFWAFAWLVIYLLIEAAIDTPNHFQ